MTKVEKNITVVFSGDGESSCWAVDENTYDKIHYDELLKDSYATRIKKMNKNHYVRLANGDCLYNIDRIDFDDIYPEQKPNLKGFRVKMIFEPILKSEVNVKYFEDDEE